MTPSLVEALEAFKKTYQMAIQKRPEDVLSVDEMDEMIHKMRAKIGQFVMATTISVAINIGMGIERNCTCGNMMENHHRPKLRVTSMQGTHEADGISYRCENCGHTERPVHDKLGIENYSKTTILFDRLSADFFLDKGAPTAARRIKEHHGVESGRTTILLHAEQRGKQARDFIDQKLNTPIENADIEDSQKDQANEVFVQMDSSSGKTIQPLVRPSVAQDEEVERTPIRNLPKVKRPVEGRQVKLLCAQGENDENWIYDAYIGSFEQAPPKLKGLATLCGWQENTKVIMTADGEEKIREVGEKAFHSNFQFILDRPHALNHLRDVVTYGKEAIATEPPQQWVEESIKKIDTGYVAEVVDEIQTIAQSIKDEKKKNNVENVAIYFSERADAVHYEYYENEGWPKASGCVEGGHIHFIHPISKRGSGWLLDNLNQTVALACIRQNGWWDEFWQWVKCPVELVDNPIELQDAA